jgi:hypothetical protein
VNRPFVIERLRALRRTPGMWAYTREAFAAQIWLLLELVGVEYRSLFEKTFKVPHTCAADTAKLAERLDDSWAQALVNEAAKLAGLELES